MSQLKGGIKLPWDGTWAFLSHNIHFWSSDHEKLFFRQYYQFSKQPEKCFVVLENVVIRPPHGLLVAVFSPNSLALFHYIIRYISHFLSYLEQCSTYTTLSSKNVNAFSPVGFTPRISHCVQRILLNYRFPSQKVSSTTFAKDENREGNQTTLQYI